MNDRAELRSCPKCGGTIPAEAPQGLCPKCLLLQASFHTEIGASAQPGSAPPSSEELAKAFPHLEIPVFAFIRWFAQDEESARERTQEFFARLLARESLGAVDPAEGVPGLPPRGGEAFPLVKGELAHTLHDPSLVDDGLSCLVSAISSAWRKSAGAR